MAYSFESKKPPIDLPPPPVPMPTSYAFERAVQRVGRHTGRAPMREDTRAPVRGRNGELLTRNNRSNRQADQFDLPRGLERPGMTYQWVATTVLGAPQSSMMNDMLDNGWRPVPASDADGYYAPKGYQGPIERGGQMLMERPTELTREAVSDSVREAKRLRHAQSSDFAGVDKMLTETGGDRAYFEAPSKETDGCGWASPKLKRGIEAAPMDLYPKREFALGDEE